MGTHKHSSTALREPKLTPRVPRKDDGARTSERGRLLPGLCLKLLMFSPEPS